MGYENDGVDILVLSCIPCGDMGKKRSVGRQTEY